VDVDVYEGAHCYMRGGGRMTYEYNLRVWTRNSAARIGTASRWFPLASAANKSGYVMETFYRHAQHCESASSTGFAPTGS
jgi:hypothetical protein